MAKLGWVSLGELVPGILAAWESGMDAPINSVREVWAAVVGEKIAGNAFPLALEEGVLFVSIESPVWSTELAQIGVGKIADDLNRRLGSPEIRRLIFTTRRPPAPNKSEGVRDA